MEELAIMSSEEKTAMIKLPESAVKGLAPINIQMMKQTAVDVNESWAVAGNAIKTSCYTLHTLKKNVKRGNWTAFIKSGVLNISAKTASDLVNVYDKWLVYSDDVPDSLLSTMSPRTLSAVANTDERTRNIILSKVISAASTSESDVRKIIKDAAPNKAKLMIDKMEWSKDGKAPSTTKEVKEFNPKADNRELLTDAEELRNLNRYSKAEVIQFVLNANKTIKKLQSEIEFANAG